MYDKYVAEFYLPDERRIVGTIYGKYYCATYWEPPDFVEREQNPMVLTWEDGTELTDEEYDMPLFFKDSDYHCLLHEYALDMIFDFGKFISADEDFDYEDMAVEYIALDRAYRDSELKPSFSTGFKFQ